MDIAKGIGLLITGVIIGYGLSYTEINTQQEHLTNKEVHSAPTLADKKNDETTAEIKYVVSTDKHDDLDEMKLKDTKKHGDISSQNLEDQKQQLMDNYFSLQKKYQKSQRKIASLKNQLGQLDKSNATDEEMESLVPKPFKSFLSAFRGKTRNDIFDFHNQEADLDWGYDKRHSISDYVQTHYEGTSVELISVICKQPRCEILLTEKQEDAWNKIMRDMSQQPWWTFSSFTSSTRSNAENEMSIYGFFSQ